MVRATSVLQTPTFKKAVKKLKPSHKKELDTAIKAVMAEPTAGEQKKGDLAFLQSAQIQDEQANDIARV